MPTTTKTNRAYWVTPAFGVAIGLIYLIGFSVGGKPGCGLIALGIMVVFSARAPATRCPGRAGLRQEVMVMSSSTSWWRGCGPNPPASHRGRLVASADLAVAS